MKIILTESQIKSLKESLLVETTGDALTYTTKYEQRMFAWDGKNVNIFDWITIPVGTKFKYDGKAGPRAWGVLEFYCSSNRFKSLKTNVVYRNEPLADALKDKFCYNNEIKRTVKGVYDKKVSDKNIKTDQDDECIKKVTPLYKNAINWWKKRLDNPTFYNKLKSLNNYTDQETKFWITKYKNYLDNNLSGPFCHKVDSKSYTFKDGLENAMAYAEGGGKMGYHKIVFNPIHIPAEDIVVHEIQHALYDIKPMTPKESWKKIFPYKFWVSSDSDTGRVSTVNPAEESKIISKYGISPYKLADWKRILRNDDDKDYICKDTELASRVVGIKNLLKYDVDDKITVDDFKKFIAFDKAPYNTANPYWLVLCWIYNGMQDITTFVNNLNTYVVAKVEPEKDDDMKDQIT
jgi:hypothetical protein